MRALKKPSVGSGTRLENWRLSGVRLHVPDEAAVVMLNVAWLLASTEKLAAVGIAAVQEATHLSEGPERVKGTICTRPWKEIGGVSAHVCQPMCTLDLMI